MAGLRSRQVHLDFHTSEAIKGIGAQFSRKQFQAALKAGHVNSITVFAKCHHSWSYYPTRVGKRHPHLACDLLGRQIAACHAIDVRAPIYLTVGWSATDAEQHPEWVVRDKEGRMVTRTFDVTARPESPKPGYSWKYLCPNGAYHDLIVRQTAEICRRYPVDGMFYDICFSHETCYCATCRKGMKTDGFDVAKEADAKEYNRRKWRRLMTDCNAVIRTTHPAATIFYNSCCGTYAKDYLAGSTHFEHEDLPTTWGGYNKFPLRAKRFAPEGKDYMAMSGKFHTSWGEFGGFKHPDALRSEAAAMIAWGARCSFGDQLHPSGRMDPETYRIIGAGYRYVRQIESYGLDGKPCANLGVWLTGAEPHDQGVVDMLLEQQIDFEVIHTTMDLNRFDTVILGGNACLDDAAAARLKAYSRQGGGLVIMAESALDTTKQRLMLDIGATYVGPAAFEQDYLVAGPALAQDGVVTPFLNYTAALRVRPTSARVLAKIREPFFDRTYGRYCSHLNTPYQLKDAPHPGALQKGRVIYLPHPLGKLYHEHGARLHRQFFINGLRQIYRHQILRVDMPSGGRVNLIHQPRHHRYVAHLLYAPPSQRGRCQIIEDLIPLRDVPVELRVPEAIRRVRLVPGRKTLPCKQDRGLVRVMVPEVRCHQAVVFEY